MLEIISHFQKQEFLCDRYSWCKEMWLLGEDPWQNSCFCLMTSVCLHRRHTSLQAQDFKGILSLRQYENRIQKLLPKSYYVLAILWDYRTSNKFSGRGVCVCVCNWIWHEWENFEYTWNVDELLAWKLSLRWIKPPPPPATKACGRKAEAEALQIGGLPTKHHRRLNVHCFLGELTCARSLCQGTKSHAGAALHSWVRKVDRGEKQG